MNLTIINKPNSHKTDIQNELHTFAASTGKHLGLQNLPKNHSEYCAMFLNLLKSKIQSYIKGVELDKKPQSQKAIAQAAQKTKEDTVRVIRADLIDDDTLKNNLESQIDNMPYTKLGIFKYICINLLILALSFAEFVMIYGSLRNSGISTTGAVVASLAIGFGLFVVTDYVSYYLLASRKVWIAWVRGACISLIMFLFFYGISLIRVIGMHNEAEINKGFAQTPVSTQELPAYALALISTGLFMIGVLISMWYGLSREEKEQFKQYCKMLWQLRKVKRRISKAEKKIENTEKKAFDVSEQAITKYDEAYISQSLLNHYGNEAVALFISTNMKHRTDGYCPPFYANPNPFQNSNFSHQTNNNI